MYFKDNFLEHLKTQRYAKGTIGDYDSILNTLENFLKGKEITDEKKVTREMLLEFFHTFTNPGMISAYQRSHIAKVTKFFRYLEEQQKIFLSPLRDYMPPKFYANSYPTLKAQEIEDILKKIKTNKPIYIEGIAIIELMYSSALRPREVYNLKFTDIDYTNKLLFIEQSKNKKDRIIPAGRRALYWLDRYINEVRPLCVKGNKHNFVFMNPNTGKQLDCRGTRVLLQRILKENGLEKIKPYSLRSTSATTLLLNGMPVEYISKLLGHVEIRSTQIYLRVKKHELGKKLEKAHPRIINNKLIEK